MLLREIMSVPVVTIGSGVSVAQALATMHRAGIRHLVVRDPEGRRAGIVCVHDLESAAPDATVGEVTSAPLVTLPPDAEVREAAKLLRRRNVGSVAVVRGDRLVGIVTVSDLLDLLGKGALHIQPSTAKWTLPRRGPTHHPEPRRRP